MIICATAFLYYVIASQGYHWEGAGTAWLIAALLDASLIAFFIYMKYKRS